MGLVWYKDGFKTNKHIGVGVYGWGSRRGHSFSLGINITVIQVEIYALTACTMENVKKATQVGTSTFFLMVRQPSRPLKASR